MISTIVNSFIEIKISY